MTNARYTDLLAAEWLKLRSLRSTYWALGIGALAVVGFNANEARSDYANYPYMPADMKTGYVDWALRSAFTDGAALILILVCASVGALTIVGEYATGLIRTTFTAVPDRRALMAAKLTVVTGVMTGYGAVLAGASYATTQGILSGRGADVPVTHPGVVSLLLASVLLAPVAALAGMALGAVIRHGATTTAAITVVLLLLPTFITDRYAWTAAVRNALPVHAWARLVDVTYGESAVRIYPPHYPATVTGSWVVLAAWAAVAAVVAVVAVERRDV
ncbi:ABC transporter permease [Streptomyces sp. GESEQ-35]|uniref:ABC transporter permease n=1 Tax=Streptomyces sp. GESEQ-35 TaxID=2812657 RepID=UPI001B31C718|nr:ABC transporter permease [Streptomyces sp. GESEQ-35]